MKFIEAKIYGFGKWVDFTINFSGNSPICIFGENESGKTTLQRFILFVLFGLPPKQRRFYRPKMSSKMGGRLTILDSNHGKYTIERLDDTRNGAAVCYTDDGLEHDEDWLKERLNGMTEDIYKSIYSFNASDLSAIQSMKQEEIGDILLGIGLTGSTHIYTLEKQLDAKIGELFKPYGSKPIINEQLAKLDRLAANVHDYKREETTYHEKREILQQLETNKDKLQTQLKRKREQVIQLEKKLQALPHAHEFKTNIKQLEQLPTDSSFPQNGVERLNMLKEKQLPLQSELSILKTDKKSYSNEKANLENDLKQIVNIDDLKKILEMKPLYLNEQQELKKLNDAIKSLEMEIENLLNDLNVGINADDIHTIELPFHTEKTWNELKNKYTQLKIEKNQLTEESQTISSKQSYLKKKLNKLRQQQITDEERMQLEKRIEEFNESELLQRLNQDLTKIETNWKKNKNAMKKRNQSVLVVSIVLTISLLALYFSTDINLFMNLAIVCLIAGIIFWNWGKLLLKNIEKMTLNQAYELKTSPYTDYDQQEAKQLILLDDEMKNEEKLINDQLKNVDIQILQYNEKKKSWDDKNNRFWDQYNEQHRLHPYLAKVEINFWPEFFHNLKNIIRFDRDKEKLEIEAESLKKKQLKFARHVQNINLEGQSHVSAQSIEKQLDWIEQQYTEFKEKQARISQLNDLLDNHLNRQQKLEQKMDTYHQEISYLFKLAGVLDEESFYKKAADLQEANHLKKAIDKIKDQFSTVFTNEEWTSLINDMPKQSQLELNMQDKQKSIDSLEKELEIIRQNIADVQSDLTRIETSETFSEVMYRLDIEKNVLNDLARQWAILQTAKEALAETKWRYRDKYLSQVIERTTVYFKELTGERYTRIFTPEDNKPFLVEASDSIRYTVDELSQGTINQLYVSLRLAISEVMNKKHHLPFIIDDAFVHFDGVRMKRILEILTKQAKMQQFIIFTCKEEVADCFESDNLIDLKKKVSHV